MVIGSYSVSVDSKGRIFVPSRWRDDFTTGSTVIIMRGYSLNPDEHFLTVMTPEYFEKFSGDLNSLHPSSIKYNDAARNVMMNCYDSQVDGKGRISINSGLLKYAGITSGAMAVATRNNCFEIWEPERLEAKNRSYTQLDASKDLQKRANELERAGK